MNGGLPIKEPIDIKHKKNRRLFGKNKLHKRKNRQKFNNIEVVINNNCVTNLSKHILTISELSVLNRGLNFCPTQFVPKYKDIDKDISRFERRLQLYYYFAKKNKDDEDDENNGFDFIKPILQKNSSWWPKKLNHNITTFCTFIKNDLCRIYKKKHYISNLSSKEFTAFRNLKRNTNITVKKCDKGGGIAVMDTEEYRDKIYDMLKDTRTYTKTNYDDTNIVKLEADKHIDKLFNNGLINRKQLEYLVDFIPRCPIFYGLPKIHKPNWPLRPIVSQIDGPTSRLNELVDKYLAVAENNIPYLLQDTTAFINLLNKHKHIKDNTILVSMDVVSLYTNIPQDEGADFVSDFYEETLTLWDRVPGLVKPVNRTDINTFIRFILNNTTFMFNNEYYKQNYGTTMGARFSVKFANIYMYKWFKHYLSFYTKSKPEFIARLVDDCFFIWNHSLEDLQDLFTYLNNCHSSIKFEFNYSTSDITFLDTVVYIDNNTIKTKLYTKPTDKKQYLDFNSNHPFHIKKSLPYSQALRYRRIIEDESILKESIKTLETAFLNRNYPYDLVHNSCDRAIHIDRASTLIYKTELEKRNAFDKYLKGFSFLPLIIPYHNVLDKHRFKDIFYKKWIDFCTIEDIKDIFKVQKPQIVYKKGPTIGNNLCKSKFQDQVDIENLNILLQLYSENDNNSNITNIKQCGHPKCKCCDHIDTNPNYSDSDHTQVYTTNDSFNCNSKDIIYLITCNKCNKMYVGQTARLLKERLNNHRSDIKLKKNTAIGIHFNDYGHTFTDLRIKPIANISNLLPAERYKLEYDFFIKLNTVYPNGLNCYPIRKDNTTI